MLPECGGSGRKIRRLFQLFLLGMTRISRANMVSGRLLKIPPFIITHLTICRELRINIIIDLNKLDILIF